MKRIKILYLIDVFKYLGGTENHLLQLASGLNRDRFHPIICPLSEDDSQMIRLARQAGIEVSPLPIHHLYGPDGARQISRTARRIRRERIDIVQNFHFMSDVVGTLSAKLAGKAMVLSSRRDKGFNENKAHFKVMRRLIRPLVNLTITVSEDLRLQINRQEKCSLERIRTIHNGSCPLKVNGTFNRAEKASQLGLTTDAPIIGTVANIRPIKGLEYLVHAAAKITVRFPQAQFIVVGGDAADGSNDGYKSQLRALVAKLGMENRIHFLHQRKDVADLFHIMDIFMLPSLSEGFSNSLLEAMHAGLPTVATAVGGNPEAVENGISGLLVPAGDSESLAKAILGLLSDPRKAKALGAAAQKKARDQFSLDRMIECYEKLYLSVLNGNGAN